MNTLNFLRPRAFAAVLGLLLAAAGGLLHGAAQPETATSPKDAPALQVAGAPRGPAMVAVGEKYVFEADIKNNRKDLPASGWIEAAFVVGEGVVDGPNPREVTVAAGETVTLSWQFKPTRLENGLLRYGVRLLEQVVAVRRGDLTRQSEGTPENTRYIHWPGTPESGVTVGYGYDLGRRSKAEVIQDLKAAGMEEAQAKKIAEGAGKDAEKNMTGQGARKFCSDNAKDIGEVAEPVKRKLLANTLKVYTQRAKETATDAQEDKLLTNARGREIQDKVEAGTYVLTEQQWNALSPAVVELLTDLAYQGGYYKYDRVAKINLALKQNEGKPVEQLKAVRELFEGDYMDKYAKAIGEKPGAAIKEEFFGTEVEMKGKYRRNQIRLAYLNHVIQALEGEKDLVFADP